MYLLTAKKKFIRNLTILTLSISILTVLIFQLFFTEQYFVCYPLVPLYFYLFSVLFINVYLRVCRHNENKIMPALLVLKGLKFFLTIVAVMACGFFARHYAASFGLTVAAHYFIYLAFETYSFFCLEMNAKQKKQ